MGSGPRHTGLRRLPRGLDPTPHTSSPSTSTPDQSHIDMQSAPRPAVPSTRIRIILDLDPAADPIGGRLRSERAPATAFSGWLALGRAIDQELAWARQTPPPDQALHPQPDQPARPDAHIPLSGHRPPLTQGRDGVSLRDPTSLRTTPENNRLGSRRPICHRRPFRRQRDE
jgi:hypothetical protein